ncbi:MAG: hypothetical protein HQK82_08265 [Desulfovibrionaceae bacterium]|nr:hypothetical protein [Desulfovibrionaceae bacterium]
MKPEDCEPFDYYVELWGGYAVWYRKIHENNVNIEQQITDAQLTRDFMEFEKYERDTIKAAKSESSVFSTKKKRTNRKKQQDKR